MSSALGKQLGLTSESTLEEIVIALGNIIDYSNTIQTALEGSSSDNSVSRYRVNGNYIEVAPASGLWNNWGWEVSCIKVPYSSVNINSAQNLHTDRAGVAGITKYVSVPSNAHYCIVCFVSMRYGNSVMSQSGVSILWEFINEEVNGSSDNERTWCFYGSVTPGSTITLVANAHNGSNHVQATTGCIIFF